MVHPVKLGKNVRMSYSRIDEVIEMPNLIEIQKNSYNQFLEDGLREVFRDVNPITDYTGNLILEFVDYSLDETPKYSVDECKERDATYSAPLKVKVRLINKETGEVKEQEIFMGDFPLMTETGTFIINGAERVIVSQLVRSPGIYYAMKFDKTGKKLFSNTIIPNRGAWLEYETDSNDILSVRIDRTRKLPITVLIRALGYGTDLKITELLGEDERILATIQKDGTKTEEEALLEIYKRLRPGEPPTVESARSLLNNLLFDPKRYDLGKPGRFKFNKKLSFVSRINGFVAAESIIDPNTGEVIVKAGESIDREKAEMVENAGVDAVYLDAQGKTVKVISNGMVDIKEYVEFDPKEIGINENVRKSVLFEILEENQGKSQDELKKVINEKIDDLIPKHIILEDIIASISYIINLSYGIGNIDDIDHLGNRRLRSVGELLQNQFRIGLARMERVVRERMTIQDIDIVTPQALINIRPVVAAIKEFFGSSQLSQFMDQTNPLAELTHKRRLSALGPGGLSRDRAGFEVRDVHNTHYGRICPIETPEGPNIGLINYLTSYAKVNEYGFIETPYRKVDKEDGYKVLDNEVVYLSADKEMDYVIAQANEVRDGHLTSGQCVCRYQSETVMMDRSEVELVDVSPKQIISVAAACIPFLENDDCTRALMGANMQRQAVPLIQPHSPDVGTGMEYKIAHDAGSAVIAERGGVVTYVDATKIVIQSEQGEDTYDLIKFRRSNTGTCINQTPIVKVGEIVQADDIIADGPSMEKGELALGQNVKIAFMTWNGYNYEDAIIMSESLVKNDIFTSIHIEEHTIECRKTKLGDEEITRDIPNVSEQSIRNLDSRGIIRVGAEVKEGDILVGKVTPKGQSEGTPEEKLLAAIFGEKSKEVRDNSLKVPHGGAGIVQSIRRFTKDNHELPSGVEEIVKVYIVQKRKISEGDKMAGRHGNKGVISKILPEEDMPFMADGTQIDVMLNPFGVPSRMNIGQVLEVHLGLAAERLGCKFATPVFDGINNEELMDILKETGASKDGKVQLFDGRTGEPFDERIAVGVMYMIKLAHMVDDKLHARATGPYSLVTQQPLGGKAQNGGQRFGEMEVWALEAFGAASILSEMLTIKSDDVMGRTRTYEAIIKGKPIPESSVGESFRVLVHELKALSLDVQVIDKDGNIMDISQNEEEVKSSESETEQVFDIDEGYGIVDIDGEESIPEAAVITADDMDYDF